MKKLLLAALLTLIPALAFSGVGKDNAYLLDNYFSADAARQAQLGENLYQGTVQVATGVWDFADQGGSMGYIDLGVDIPNNAVVKQVYYTVKTQPVVGSGSPKFQLGASTANGYDYNELVATAVQFEDLQDEQSAAGALDGNALAATYIAMGASTKSTGWDLKLKAQTAAGGTSSSTVYLTAGKVVFFVEYVVAD